MNILSLFVLIPALMLLGLWIARNLNQVRGVMSTLGVTDKWREAQQPNDHEQFTNCFLHL